ncbi:MAG: NAD(P)/FAD-dependent oxidoreductase [Betaproteobacteria bacterium]|nr:NAD(P)/FAD-dependent oxidoreductase [Betaproteobacteria bacterium]
MSQSNQGRRGLLKAGAGAAVLGGAGLLTGCETTQGFGASQKKLGRVIVIGGGYGGATAAKYLSHWSGGAIEVVLIEREREFYSCPISNLVLGGSVKMDYIKRDYRGLRERGILVLNDEVTKIDPVNQKVSMKKIADMKYDRLVVSPGIDFNFGAIKGLDAEAQKTVLHSWKAGAQTIALRAQLEAMKDGGTYILTIPKAPYRCPPGPYERACQVASYFKQAKPKSKVLVLDANPDVQSKKGLFMKAWTELYGGIITYTPNMVVNEIDMKSRTLITEVGDKVKGDVINIIPPNQAGDLARGAGLVNANNLWCGVDWMTMESTAFKNIHVLGDATLSAPAMPKSGHMANQHGKTAAAAIIEIMNGRAPVAPMMANTCYSFVDSANVVHVASVHTFDKEKKTMVTVAGSGGLSTVANEVEGKHALNWAQNIWADMLT